MYLSGNQSIRVGSFPIYGKSIRLRIYFLTQTLKIQHYLKCLNKYKKDIKQLIYNLSIERSRIFHQ